MNQQIHVQRQGPQDIDQWVNRLSLGELRRLAEFCGVPIKNDDRSLDIIDRLQMARRDELDVEHKVQQMASSATAFDVRDLRTEVSTIAEQNRNRVNAAIAQLRQDELSKVGSKLEYLEAQAHRNESLRSLFGIIAGAVSFMIGIAAVMGLNIGSRLEQIGKTAEKTAVIEKQIEDLEVSKQELRHMMLDISTHTGVSMISKLNPRLDQLRSMKSYHITPLIENLSLETHADLFTIKRLRERLADEQPSEAYRLLTAVEAISSAIGDLPHIYRENELDLERLRSTRQTWSELHDDVTEIQMQLLTMSDKAGQGDPSKLLRRFKATVYEIEAGLAIQEYRNAKLKREDLLNTAEEMCDHAIHENASTMAFINKGLISSLRVSRALQGSVSLADVEEDVLRLETAGEEAYLEAIRRSQSQELTAHALNNLAYLYVKTGNAYSKAADEARKASDLQAERKWIQRATPLLASAKDRVNQALGVREPDDPSILMLNVDPIILTTKADIEISFLALLSEEELAKENRYERILGLLKQAVAAGYSGYESSQQTFFENRPHFKNLARLNGDYQRDVCKAVGIRYDSRGIDTSKE